MGYMQGAACGSGSCVILGQPSQVWTTCTPAEKGHNAGGAFNVTTKVEPTSFPLPVEERYISKGWIGAYFQQSVANLSSAYFEYHKEDVYNE
jgi:hypothetical protein